jgi:hypothetical protein
MMETLSQELYINKIFKRWGMESCKPVPTPFPAKSDVVLDELHRAHDNAIIPVFNFVKVYKRVY